MQRVMVIGSPGSGKSTLATELARKTGLPLIHLDQLYWRPGWVETPDDEWQRKVAEAAAGERWVIDGNYGGTMEIRLARADTVVDLEYPAWLCVWRILRRIARSWGRVRADMAEGCREQFSPEFIVYTAMFPRRARKRTDAKLRHFSGERIHLRSPAEAARFLASLDRHG